MFRIFFSGIILFYNVICLSQGLVNNGAEISITQGALLAICGSDGNYINLNDGSSDGIIELAGNIELKGNWINNSSSGTFVNDLTDGNIVFSGNDEQIISGTQITDFENVIIDKSDILKLDISNCFIHGNFLINNGSFDLNQNTLTISGNWENYDSFFANNGSVIFNGNKVQKIISGNCNFSEIVFENYCVDDYDINICQDISFDKYAEFINGIVYSSNNSKIYFNSGALCNGGSDSSFICGFVTKIGEDDFIFPIGTVSDSALIWAPLSISTRSVNDIFTCQYFDTAAPNNLNLNNMSAGLHHVSGTEYWLLEQISGSSSPFITLYSKNNVRSGISYPSDIVVAGYEDNTLLWESLDGNFYDNANSGYIISDIPYIDGKIYTFGTKQNSNPLPISLLDFYADCYDNYIEVKWATSSETNSDFFILEKSTNLSVWNLVAKISAAGNSNQILYYSATDEKNIIPYVIYYRLKQIDIDGNEIFFNPINVKCSDNNNIININLFPNPFYDNLNIEINGYDGNNIVVELFESTGKKIFSKIFDINDLNKINTYFKNQFSNGVYFILFKLNNKIFTFKLIKL